MYITFSVIQSTLIFLCIECILVAKEEKDIHPEQNFHIHYLC